MDQKDWWQTFPWHWWADLFFGQDADPSYDETSKQIEFIEKAVPLAKTQKILDLACGNGRHATELAKKGYTMTCFDYSAEMLKLASQKAKSANVNLEIQQGDMRQTSWKGEFDVVLNLFGSFGYFENYDEDEKVLKNVFEALKASGKFLLDVRNRNFVFSEITNGQNAVLKPFYQLPGSGWVKIKEQVVKPNFWKVDYQWYRGDGIVKNSWNRIRLYNFDELKNMLEKVGFSIEKTWGDYTGEDYYPQNSKRIIILAYKPY